MQLQIDPYSLLMQMLWIGMIMLLSFQGQKIQFVMWMSQIRKAVLTLKEYSNKATEMTLAVVKDLGKPTSDPKKRIEEILEFVMIEPVSLDPAGVLTRLEHLLDVRNERFEEFVKIIAPNAIKSNAQNIENTLEATIALNQVYRVIRHYYITGRKTQNVYVAMQVQMQLPQIMRIAKAYSDALKAFANGVPIGDGLGPFVVGKIVDEARASGSHVTELGEIAKDISAFEVPFEKRKMLLIRAQGPGGTVGKPGEGIKVLMQKRGKEIKRIITIDAGLKLEGEKTGDIIEGVGAAIGDPGPEKYKMEISSEKAQIPIDALIVKESIENAITPMQKAIVDATANVINRIRQMLLERTNEGDTVLVAGIGNTIGIA